MTRNRMIFVMLLLTALVSTSSWCQSKGQATAPARFVINKNRFYVYLRFDHMGRGVTFAEDEPAQRVWFRFVNNCRVGIILRTFGVPEGSPKDEVGVMYDVVKNKAYPGPPAGAQDSRTGEEAAVPRGYGFDAGSAESIPPGKSVLFSIPITHLNKSWHIEIPYEFDVPPVRGPRPPLVAGQPKMVLLYSAWDLPQDIQQRLAEGH